MPKQSDKLYRYQANQYQADTGDDWWEILNTGDPEDPDSSECVVALAETETMAEHITNIPEYLATIEMLTEAIKRARDLLRVGNPGDVKAARSWLDATLLLEGK